MTTDEQDQQAFWVRADLGNDNRYHVVFELGPDDSIPVDADAGMRWAREVMAAVVAAEYDAAIFKQLTAIGVEKPIAAAMLMAIRMDRRPNQDITAIPGLVLEPGVSAFTGKPYLRLVRHGVALGSWEMGDARKHALGVFEVFEVSAADGRYLQALMTHVGLERDNAANVVADIINYR